MYFHLPGTCTCEPHRESNNFPNRTNCMTQELGGHTDYITLFLDQSRKKLAQVFIYFQSLKKEFFIDLHFQAILRRSNDVISANLMRSPKETCWSIALHKIAANSFTLVVLTIQNVIHAWKSAGIRKRKRKDLKSWTNPVN